MNYNPYHWCIVSECKNTSVKTPGKLWIQVPIDINMRNTWLKLAKRDPKSLSTNTRLYFCEDHFDLENDMENFMQYKIMGSVKRVLKKPNCIPSRFDCQVDRKQTSTPSEPRHVIKQHIMTRKQNKTTVDLSKQTNNIELVKNSEGSSSTGELGNLVKYGSCDLDTSVNHQKISYVQHFYNLLSETTVILQEAQNKAMTQIQKSQSAITNINWKKIHEDENRETDKKMSKLQDIIVDVENAIEASYVGSDADTICNLSNASRLDLMKEGNDYLETEILRLRKKILKLENEIQPKVATETILVD